MKILTIVLLISFSRSVCAQNSIFIRVYNLAGEKINKGHVVAVTDTSLQLRGKAGVVNFPMRKIGVIKTKRSAGHNALVGSIIGASAIAILFAASADPTAYYLPFTAAEGARGGAIIGLPLGAGIGGLTTLFKKSKTYLINGDVTKWKAFQLNVTGKSTFDTY